MKLLSSGSSPFVRKINLCAAVKGVAGDIEAVKVDTNADDQTLFGANPLGKIPALILDDGTAIFDSPVICEYLDSLAASPKLIPDNGPERWRVLTLAALADGILDAGVLLVYEGRYRPAEMRVQSWCDRQHEKINRTVSHLESTTGAFSGTPDYATITMACALGYLDFRLDGAWRGSARGLVKWLDDFAAAVPAYGATKPE